MSVALVLGAGGMPGEAFHHGVLQALADVAGVAARDVDLVLGTSAGSLVAATLRAPAVRPVEAADAPFAVSRAHRPDVTGWMHAMRRPWQLRPAGLPLSLLPAGGHSPEAICEGVRYRHGLAWPDRPTWVVAVRRDDGRRVVFGRDTPHTDLGTAVAASCAVPLVFSPVMVDGHAYVDGGVHSPTNADLVAHSGCDLVIVSAPMSMTPAVHVPGPASPLRLWWHRQLRQELRAVRRRGARVLAVEPDAATARLLGLRPLRAHRLDEISDAAFRSTAELLRQRGFGAQWPAA